MSAVFELWARRSAQPPQSPAGIAQRYPPASSYPQSVDWTEIFAERDREGVGAIVIDQSLTVIATSQGILDAGGYIADVLNGSPVIDVVHPDDLARAAQVLSELKDTPGERPGGMYRLKLADGTYRQFTIRAYNFGSKHDGAIVFDVLEPTNSMRAEAFADDAVDVISMLSENLSMEESLDWVIGVGERHVPGLQIVVTIFDSEGPNLVFSRQEVPAELLHLNCNTSASNPPRHVQRSLDEMSTARWRSSRKIAILDEEVPGRLTSVLVGRDASLIGYVEALRCSTGEPADFEWLVHGMISRMMSAVLYHHESDRQLRFAANHDALTGLVNRRRLFELLETEPRLPGSYLYLVDLDRFSWVNNNLGHQTGDEVLATVASCLTDACPEEAVIARLGGDEFVVYIPADKTPGNIEQLGEAIRKAMVLPIDSEDRRVQVRGSIGMVMVASGESAADAINRADAAMYVSKRSGGDAVTAG